MYVRSMGPISEMDMVSVKKNLIRVKNISIMLFHLKEKIFCQYKKDEPLDTTLMYILKIWLDNSNSVVIFIDGCKSVQ